MDSIAVQIGWKVMATEMFVKIISVVIMTK